MKRVVEKLARLSIFKTLTRKTLDKNIVPIISKCTKGSVLDIGALDSPYKKYMSYSKYATLDIERRENVDYVMDIHETKFKDKLFDTIIATEVLEHLYNPFKAVDEIHRILKPGGYLIASTRFIYTYHGEPNDYFRFTTYGLESLFTNYDSVKIIPLGNRLMAILDLITTKNRFFKMFRLMNVFLNMKSVRFSKAPLGFIVVVQK